MKLCGLLQENLLLQKFERDVTGTNIVLLEIRNHLLICIMQSQEKAQMVVKMILVMLIIPQYQNERLKACNNLPGILFISFVKD